MYIPNSGQEGSGISRQFIPLYEADCYISIRDHVKLESQLGCCRLSSIYAFSLEVHLEWTAEQLQRAL
jgi:hypothetical protein